MATKQMTEEVHKYGSKILLQLSAGSGRTLPANEALMRKHGLDPEIYFVAPSDDLPNVWFPDTKHRGLTTEEVYQYIESFIESAKMAQEAGFDGIEIHAVHEGYLIDQFTMECTNQRTDEFGGSLENRLRFPCEIIKGVKKACGEDFVVSVRYSVASKMKAFNSGALPGEAYKEFGRSLEESPQVARILEEAGCDVLDADNGSYDAWYWAHPPVYMPMGCNMPEVAYIKNFVDIPVICAGRMDDPDLAARVIENGTFDGIGIARAFLADPDWVNKVEAGDTDDIRPCIACHNGCLAQIFIGNQLTCAVNPAVYSEEEYRLVKTDKPKKVAVIGGGIGGMEVARLATERGHDVTLFEKTGELGGVFIAAAAPDFKESDKKLIRWYKKKVEDAGVKVLLNTEATVEALKASGVETVIVATGSTPKELSIKGIDSPKVVEAIDYLKDNAKVGDNVAIIGGGLTGCEIAYSLAKSGKTPIVIEMLDDILKVRGLSAANRNMLVELLQFYNVEVLTSSTVEAITSDGVEVTDAEGKQHLIKVDSVITAVGYDSFAPLAETLKDSFAEVYIIGDAKEVGTVMTVVKDAYDIAYAL